MDVDESNETPSTVSDLMEHMSPDVGCWKEGSCNRTVSNPSGWEMELTLC